MLHVGHRVVKKPFLNGVVVFYSIFFGMGNGEKDFKCTYTCQSRIFCLIFVISLYVHSCSFINNYIYQVER